MIKDSTATLFSYYEGLFKHQLYKRIFNCKMMVYSSLNKLHSSSDHLAGFKSIDVQSYPRPTRSVSLGMANK